MKYRMQSFLPADALHRRDFRTCPHCGKKTVEFWDWNQWAFCMIPELSRESNLFLKESVIIVSECPDCFGYSWVHERYFGVKYDKFLPEEWKQKVKEIEKKEAKQ